MDMLLEEKEMDLVLDKLPIALDLHKMIKQFLYHECHNCNTFVKYPLLFTYFNKVICVKCYRESDYHFCRMCRKYYLRNDNYNKECEICGAIPCHYYCPECVDKPYTPFSRLTATRLSPPPPPIIIPTPPHNSPSPTLL